MRMGTGFLVSLFASGVVWMISDHIGLGTIVRLIIVGVILLIGSTIGSDRGSISGVFSKLKLPKSSKPSKKNPTEASKPSGDAESPVAGMTTKEVEKTHKTIANIQKTDGDEKFKAYYKKIQKEEAKIAARRRRGPSMKILAGGICCLHLYIIASLSTYIFADKSFELIGANGLITWFSSTDSEVSEEIVFDGTLEPGKSQFVKFAAGDTIKTEAEDSLGMRINNAPWFGISKDDSRTMETDGSLLILNNNRSKEEIDVVIKKIPKPKIVAKEEPRSDAKKKGAKTKKGEKPPKSFWPFSEDSEEDAKADPKKDEEPGALEETAGAVKDAVKGVVIRRGIREVLN